MIVALNMLLGVVVLILLYTSYRIKKVWPLLVAIAFIVVYTAVQPSYMPKGTVKAYIPPPFEKVEGPVVNRLMMPKTAEQYDAERNAAIELINNKMQDAVQNIKK